MGLKGPIGAQTRANRNKQARNAPKSEPIPPRGLNNAAKVEWARITGLLRDRNALDSLDQVALQDYLQCWVRLRECEANIEREGLMVEGANGRGKVKNPACQLAREYRDSLLAWCKELGFTYSSRTRLAMPREPERKENPFAQFART